MGFMGGSFNTREFFHGATPRWLRAVKPTFIAARLRAADGRTRRRTRAARLTTPVLLAAAFVVQYVGLLAERWFFFAQAQPSAEPVLPGGLVMRARAEGTDRDGLAPAHRGDIAGPLGFAIRRGGHR